jgi:NAD(P)-dependent dehydrogenase (short-subunit alcohol dehydrogenase family)
MGLSIVTGANRGIGLELCRLLAARGAEVVGVCRKPSAELEGLGARMIGGIDVRDDRAPEEVAAQLRGAPIDLLIHNAGISSHQGLGNLDVASILAQFETNALGPLRLTAALLPALHEGSKIAMVTSLMGSSGDNASGGAYGYRMSKAALNIAAVSLARDLAARRIWVGILHPGYVRTGMTGGSGNIDAVDSARGLIARIDALGPETTGRFFHQDGRELPW